MLCKSKIKHKKFSLSVETILRKENLRKFKVHKIAAKVSDGGMTKHIKRDQQMRNLKCHA